MSKSSLDYSEVAKTQLDRKLKNFPFPPVFILDTISHCSLRCHMCPHKDLTRKKGIMSWELYKKLIDEIASKKPDARVWITFAGEGSILKDLPEKIEYAKNAGLKDVVLNSNGTRLTPKFSERLIKAGLNVLMVGIDAATPETYAKLRIGGRFEETVSNVLAYKDLLDKLGKPDQRMNVQFVQMPENSSELEAFVDFWNSKNIDVKIKPMVSWINRKEAANLMQSEERLPCFFTCGLMAITDTGKVALCGADLDCATEMGDVSQRSIEEVWQDRLQEVRLAHLKGEWDKLPDACRTCRDWQSGYSQYARK